ncbi:MAG: 4'-phosphopantetheinyl transferase family protein [Candidatus Avelusimicrobium sp.]|uniref:4'-phosphopantetheinyl transferase family protein n=1 Tax=Candidatus Avelusimicrobium sp. TaxID=3048833 RepID=UPI003F1288FD
MPYQLKVVDLSGLPPADGILSERERAFYETLRFPKRRTEWLGGRFALKQLAAEVFGKTDLRQVEVLPHESGKPVLWVGGDPCHLAFSITHSSGYAAAAVSTTNKFLGIDLEKTEHRIEAWAKDFFHPSELTDGSDAFLTALWTQKEALVKLLGTGLSLNSYEVRCVNGIPQFFGSAQDAYSALGAPEISVHTCELISGFMFSAAYGNRVSGGR